jgi:hypothetical protein
LICYETYDITKTRKIYAIKFLLIIVWSGRGETEDGRDTVLLSCTKAIIAIGTENPNVFAQD